MSFSSEIKNEILINKKNKKERKLFLLGFLFANVIKENNNFFIFLRNKIYQKEIINLLEEFKINYEFFSSSSSKIRILKVSLFKNYPINNFTNFMSGVFLSGGSISDFNNRFYHLELKINNLNFSKMILKDLKKHNLPFQNFEKHNRYILYIKKSEMIGDFLKAIGAIKNFLKFENARIERDYYNYNNKVTNLSILNQKKLVESNFQYLENYKFIQENNLQKLFREDEINFFELKKENRFDSLADLSELFYEKYEIKKSKSALNHYLRKLKKIVELYNKKR